MPVASSSRRRQTRRQASSDIEEENPTQRGPQEEVDEDEEDQPRRKNLKKERTSAKKAKVEKGTVQAHDEDDEDDEDDDRIDITNFQNQPLRKADATKLQGLTKDWESLRQNIAQNFKHVRSVAISVADATEPDQGAKSLIELEAVMKNLIDIDEEMRSHSSALDDILQKVYQDEEIDDAVERYNTGFVERIQAYTKKTTRQKYAKHDQYMRFKQGVYEIVHDGAPMPPMTEFIPQEAGDDSDDDDLEIGGVTQDYKCPLTLMTLTDPVTSSVCGHSFSREGIQGLFGSDAGLKRCPASGCNKSFRLSDCKPDKELEKKVNAAARRARRREEEMDDGDLVE